MMRPLPNHGTQRLPNDDDDDDDDDQYLGSESKRDLSIVCTKLVTYC